MKRLFLALIFCLSVPITAKADNILIFGDYSSSRSPLEFALVSLSHTVTNVTTLPADLSGFDTIWHVGASTSLTADEQLRLADFLANSGGIHLTGERPCCESMNDSLQAFINSVVVGGAVQVGDLGDIVGPYTINPSAHGGLASTPNTVSNWIPSASGGMGGLGSLPSANILASGAGDVPTGGAWISSELVSATGRLTILMDVNWFQNLDSGDNLAFVDNIQLFLSGEEAEVGTARFRATKTFSNGADGDVEVTLTCNGGLPLQQSFTISGGDPAGVTFVVTNLPDGGADCEVTEDSDSDAYTAEMNDGAGCAWTGVQSGVRSCAIENVAVPTTLMVDTDVVGAEGSAVDTSFTTTLTCDDVSPNSGPDDFGTYSATDTTGELTVDWYAEPDETANCTATVVPNSSAVEGSSCTFSFVLGDAEAGCDVEGTVFFEGIPTLSQYGLALMALLMLGVGFVGMRRFV